MSPRMPRVVTAATAIGIVGLIVVFVLFAANAPRTTTANIDTTGYAAAPAPPKGAEVVYVGIEPIQVYAVSLETDTFQSSFYIWWRWHGNTDPCTSTDILNSTNSSNYYLTIYSYTNAAGVETPIKLANGDWYQSAKISVGVSDPFSVSRYPLDSQILRIRIENNTYDYDQIVYVPDLANMSKHPSFEVAGWDLTGESVGQYLHTYGTNFGTPGQGISASQYSQLTYDIEVVRPFSHFMMKLYLPMFVVLIAALSALFVKADHFDVRLAMAGTGLLTLIFLQQGYSGDLPSTSPVVMMDEIYALAYAAVGVTFMRVIYTTTRIHHSGKLAEFFVRNDRVIAVLLTAAFLVGSTILVAA